MEATDDQRAQGCAWAAGRTTAQGEDFQGTRYRCVCGVSMFYVGKTPYLVRISDKPLQIDGRRCDGLCDPDTRTIQISPLVQPERRLNVLLHELFHGFEFGFGFPRDSEALADFGASVCERAIHDLTAAGGIQALQHLRAGEEFGLSTARIGLEQSRPCGQCGCSIAPGEVYCRPDPLKPGQLNLAVFCDFCGVSTVWNEMSACGQPVGGVMGQAKIVRGCVAELRDLSRRVAAEMA